MGNLLRRLEAKPKMFRSRAVPAPDGFVVRDSIESVIDFGGGESFRVERQHFRSGKFLGIKSSSPLGILESGSANP